MAPSVRSMTTTAQTPRSLRIGLRRSPELIRLPLQYCCGRRHQRSVNGSCFTDRRQESSGTPLIADAFLRTFDSLRAATGDLSAD